MAPTAAGTYKPSPSSGLSGDTWGGHLVRTLDYTSTTTSYVGGANNGEGPISPSAFGLHKIQFMVASGTEDGTLYGVCYPNEAGWANWYIRWYVSTTGAELANAQNPSGKVCKLFAFGV